VNPDPLVSLTTAVEEILAADSNGAIVRNHQIDSHVPWRPHLYEEADQRGWYLLSETPREEIWSEILKRAKDKMPTLDVGICASLETLKNASVLEIIDSFNAQILPFEVTGQVFSLQSICPSVAEVVIERGWILDHRLASTLLQRNWERAKLELDPHEKGRLLERVGRLLFSQVSGWRVQGHALRRKNQEIDIAAHNERAGGVLGRGEIVLGEAKNRVGKVDPDQYVAFRNKVRKTNGLAKIGFMFSKTGFTDGVILESARDSEGETLIVLVDERALLRIWQGHQSITDGMTAIVMQAIQDQRQVRVEPDW
jgi:hypothetical protein